jgi:hypothetical protein
MKEARFEKREDNTKSILVDDVVEWTLYRSPALSTEIHVSTEKVDKYCVRSRKLVISKRSFSSISVATRNTPYHGMYKLATVYVLDYRSTIRTIEPYSNGFSSNLEFKISHHLHDSASNCGEGLPTAPNSL